MKQPPTLASAPYILKLQLYHEAGNGTGLGLSISYGIITEQGGTIYAENNDNGGATFTIQLPVYSKM